MKTLVSPTRNRPARISAAQTLGWLAASSLVFAALAPSVAAARPETGPSLSVTICHATNSDSNPYRLVTISQPAILTGHLGDEGPVWSSGMKDRGESWGDIIPAVLGYTLGQNLAGHAWLERGCTALSTTVDGPPTNDDQTPANDDQTPANDDQTPANDDQTPANGNPAVVPVLTVAVEASEPSSAPNGAVAGVTGTPRVTLPPTDTLSGGTTAPSSDSWRLILLAMAGLLVTTLLLTPTGSVARRRDR